MWQVVWSDKSVRQLKRLDRSLAQRVVDRVEEIKDDPYTAVQRLVNSPYYRLRVGDYRVIMNLRHNLATIFVIQVDPRKDDYKTLRRL